MASTTSIFDTTPSILLTALYPRGLPKNAVIALAITLPSVTLLVIVMGILHCLCRRSRKKQTVGRQVDDGEVDGLGSPPALAINTNVPKSSNASQPAQGATASVPNYQSQGGGVFIPVIEGNMVVTLPTPPQVHIPMPVEPVHDTSPLASHPPDGEYVNYMGRQLKVNRGIQIGYSH